ncbi:MAG: hypothetical protein AAGA80_05250 [Cyanobacteria bacterium P01_F01_bin.143]
MTDFGTIHLVDADRKGHGTSTVAQAMFYYCLTVLRLAGTQKVSMSKVERAIASEMRRLRMSLDFGSVYSAVEQNKGAVYSESNFDCKFKHIPLLLLDTAYCGRDTYNTYRDNYEDLTFDVFGVHNRKSDYGLIVEAAVGRVVVIDSSSSDSPPGWSGNCRLSVSTLLNDASAQKIKVVRWFVSYGDQYSLDAFVDSVDRYSDFMTHVLVLRGSAWNFLGQSPYLEAINNSVVVDFPILQDGFRYGFSKGNTDVVPACFAESGQFDDLIDFSKKFKLQDLSEVSASKQTSRFANFWS